jgi:cobalt-zinc-cadmium efflux system membrane fusion protein
MKKRLPIAILTGLCSIILGCGSKKSAVAAPENKVSGDTVIIATNSPQINALTIEDVGAEPPSSLPLAGRLLWNEDATVRVFSPFAGIIRKLLVEPGAPVKRGSPLAQIQSSDFAQAVAEARKAEGDLRRAEQSLTRLRDLSSHGAVPRKELEASEAEQASVLAEKDRAERRLAIYGVPASATNQDFLLPSPLDGILVERNVTPGQEVRPDQMLANAPQYTVPLFVVTDPSRLWLQIDATDNDLPQLRTGRTLTFSTRAFPGQTFTGRVEVVSEFIDPGTRTIKVRGTVDNTQRLLKAEMFVNVNLRNGGSLGVGVPAKAVFLKGEKHYVFVEEHPGRFARKEVQVESEQAGRVLVVAGVKRGQRVVTDGCLLLQQILR